MDKSWINIRNRLDPLYEKDADDFVEFASKDRPNATEILCPCTKCRNMKLVKKVDVAEHIVVDGFLSSYTHWIFHGESSLTSNSVPEPVMGDRTQEMIRDAFGVPLFNQLDERYSGEGNENSDDLDDATKKFFNLVKEAEKELWLDQGHKFRKDKVSFDGEVELDPKLIPLSGAEVYERVKDIKNEFGASEGFVLDDISYAQAHRYVLVNSDAMTQYRREHHPSIRRSNRRLRPHDVNKVHNETFHIWFRNHVQKLYEEGDEALSEEIISLAMGPLKKAEKYT
ncbi:hypothetical protein RJ639_014745 [Escallonia herrerae]|uniref:Transposase-associated domain-containing protein n=1 Tax=Escallonia herrerae TaxID=1293975 RepID=A0AA89AMG6_9ASTE|nr:hypothetical protein RJ639_014745 [Escallonia herrerae]